MIFSCNDNKAKLEKQDVKEVDVQQAKQFIFSVDLETSSPDEFILFSNDVFLNNDQFMNVNIKQKLHSNETEKKMIFKLPQEIFPDYNLGFVLGRNTEKKIKINKIIVQYGEKNLTIPSEKLSDYFQFNRFIEVDKEGTISVIKKDNKLNPVMFLKKTYINKLAKK